MKREASHAGSWYTASGSKLNRELENWISHVPDETEDGVDIPVKGARAIIAPHAGYMYSGQAAAYAYKCIDPSFVKRVFILGPSHHVYITGCALSQCDSYETPLGDLILDKETIAELKATGHFTTMSKGVDEDEHSIEMHLPYIYKILEKKIETIKIVPVLVGALNAEKEEFYGKLLAPYLADPFTLFVVSSDFCHWGTRFSYTYYCASPSSTPIHLSSRSNRGELTIPIHESIERLDREGMQVIETGDHPKFVDYLRRTKNTICGRHPIGVLMCALKEVEGDQGKTVKFVRYEQSSKVRGERESSVSYASAYVIV
ncbi:uncharacterized protein VTP21DRAFT_7236 [Calcarisporiella thermophila]|uniref:uncharacterized protein n=1 Tax=Calcarisporiella thermophila TaxID=911321 RepID=UPI0037426C24